MAKFFDLQYGMPRAGGPDQLPPPMIWRPGFGMEPGDNPMVFPFEVPTAPLKAQVMVDNGKLAPLGTDGTLSGDITGEAAKDLKLTMDAPTVNGVYVTGDSSYTISNADLKLSGDCINDFAGNGAAVQVMKNARVVIENSKITTAGVLRSCIVADEYSTLIVNNCELISEGGVPAPDNPAWAIPAGPGMIKAPDVMKCEGHSRLSLAVGNAHAYYNNCKIVSDGWAALSTDASWGDTYLEANHCDITLKHAGYATFSDEGAVVVFNDCKVNTPSHGSMICGKAAIVFNDCKIQAGANATWMFAIQCENGSQIADLSIVNSEIETGEEAFLVAGMNANIEVRGSRIKSESGILLRGKDNKDDPMATKVNPGEPLYGIKAVFADMELEGDIIQEDNDRAMAVFLSHVKYNGAINGAYVKIDPASTWFSPRDSEIVLDKKIDISRIDAPAGVTIIIHCADMAQYDGAELASGGKVVIK